MMDASVSTSQGMVNPRPRLGRKERNRAFQRLYESHFRLVWSVIRSSGVPSEQCEDVAQEVWIQVHRLLHRLRDDASEQAWLVSIARKRVLQHHRTRHRRQRRESAWGETAATECTGEQARVEAQSVVGRMLGRMKEEQRLAFVLVHGYGLTGEEVAAAVGDSVNTVYSRLRLARRHVRRVADAAELEERRVAKTLWSHGPPRQTQRRMWGVLLVRLDFGSLRTPWLGVGLKPIATTLGIAATSLVLLRSVVAPAASPSSPEPPPAPATAATPVVHSPADAPEPAAATSAAPEPTTTAVDEPRSPATRPARRSAHIRPEPADDRPESTLAAEAALLKDAKQALDRRAPAEALALLDEHARRFPAGELQDVRRGARVRALCALGRSAQARGEARMMAEHRQGSVVAHGVQDVCTGSPSASATSGTSSR